MICHNPIKEYNTLFIVLVITKARLHLSTWKWSAEQIKMFHCSHRRNFMQLSNESLNKFTLARIQSLTPAVLVQRSSQFSQQASCNWEQSLDWFVIFQRSPHQKNPWVIISSSSFWVPYEFYISCNYWNHRMKKNMQRRLLQLQTQLIYHFKIVAVRQRSWI